MARKRPDRFLVGYQHCGSPVYARNMKALPFIYPMCLIEARHCLEQLLTPSSGIVFELVPRPNVAKAGRKRHVSQAERS